MRRWRIWVFFSSILFCLTTVAHAGTTLVGKVTLTGSPVAQATVSLFRVGTGASSASSTIVTTTNPSGFYQLVVNTTGQYIIIVKINGTTVYQGSVMLNGGQQIVNVPLSRR